MEIPDNRIVLNFKDNMLTIENLAPNPYWYLFHEIIDDIKQYLAIENVNYKYSTTGFTNPKPHSKIMWEEIMAKTRVYAIIEFESDVDLIFFKMKYL